MEDELLSVVREVVGELHRGRRNPVVRMDSKLSSELGLDSLGRLELLMRLERRLGVSVREQQALEAETPRQLLLAAQARSAAPGAGARAEALPPEPLPDLPLDATTLVETLEWFAQRHPDRVHMELYEGEDPVPISYGELWAEALQFAAGLREDGVGRGESVALMLPTSRDFFVAFAGVLAAGAVPVPIYPPFRASQVEEHLRRQALILENARATVLVASPETARAGRWLRAALPGLRGVTSVAAVAAARPAAEAPAAPPVAPSASDLALVQYTSGSTGDPKGVMLTHANLLANVRAMGEAAEAQPTDVFVSWLPLYHDMGLIGAWLGSLYHGFRAVVMPPTRFLSRPESWLRALHRHRGTISAAPNFAYELCATRIADADLEGLDLTAWRLAFNGAEPVSPSTLERFAQRFAAHGFRREALTPVYGLAEGSLGLAFPPLHRGPRVDVVARDEFEQHGRAEPAPDGRDARAVHRFVSGGRPLPHHEIRVLDDGGHELPDRTEGRIQFRGPSATSGYMRNERATRALLSGGWLESGDRGYVADGEIFVSGRSKDVIIRAGRHIFPYELEETVAAVPGVRRGGVAVFSAPDERTGTERLVVVAETRGRDGGGHAELRDQIDAAAAALLGSTPDEIVLVPPRTVPKTSSGKTRRAACRAQYLRGELGERRSVRLQVAALGARVLVPLARRALARIGSLAFAIRFWACWGLLAVPAWLFAAALPGERLRWRAVSAIARAFFRLAGIPIALQGRDQLPDRPSVLVFNHASYIDAIVLLAVLPPGFSFVGKSELAANPLLGGPLRRLGLVFVERFDPRQSLEDAALLEQRVRQGGSLVLFPEGTNRRTPGLFPFHLGAFLAAAHAGAPIVPGVITGARTVLRADQWFPRRAPITVTLLPALAPESDTWGGAVALRDRARETIAVRAGEPLVG
jgi:1-acyl-sn-glycerol-3-phosphate acyltransferase